MISIAIDGPAGAGKSTISRRLAADLGYIYVDTGALYRSIGLYALRKGADPAKESEVAPILSQISLDLRFIQGEQHVFLNGEDVSKDIRLPEVSMAASSVSAFSAVRAFLFDLQRNMAKEHNIVMDGRDIGTVVLPDAPVKIFLTASPEDRAMRRYKELMGKGVEADYEEVLRDLKQRDYNDSHREIAPLKAAEDAILADTTGKELHESIAYLKNIVETRLRELYD